MNKVKVILVSTLPLPYSKIGSWTNMYDYYLRSNHEVDIIICPKPTESYDDIQYVNSDLSLIQKVKKKFLKINNKKFLLDKLVELVEPNTRYVLQFIDEIGTLSFIADKLNARFGKHTFYYQFFYHGYAPILGNFQSRKFFSLVDEVILLTHLSYLEYKKFYTVLPCKFSILHNGVSIEKFYSLPQNQKESLRAKNNVSIDKKIFLWLSQDRPKKGLDFIVGIWNSIDKDLLANAELWIVGTNREIKGENIVCKGRIPNHLLPEVYQMTDVYLFPSLWHEGFGLSLVEALHCGCYPVVANNGGIPEVVQNGKFGVLIENPNYSEEWKYEIEKLLQLDTIPNVEFDDSLYTLDSWSRKMNLIIDTAKEILKNS